MLSFHKFLLTAIIFTGLVSCAGKEDSAGKDKNPALTDNAPEHLPKPPAYIKDTLFIRQKVALFYHPDSLQLKQIKAQTNPAVFESNMHEFYYQMRNARMVIRKNWPHLKILEAKNYRYLLFIKEDNTQELVDLDARYDPYGLFVFNRIKPPAVIDMYNVETGISFYLK